MIIEKAAPESRVREWEEPFALIRLPTHGVEGLFERRKLLFSYLRKQLPNAAPPDKISSKHRDLAYKVSVRPITPPLRSSPYPRRN